jgi:transposase
LLQPRPEKPAPAKAGGEHPRAHLASLRGILQADGYAGYAGLYDRGVTEAACWAHARRNFFDVHAATQSPLALEALRRIAALYAIEATIRGRPPDARLAARTAQSAPLFIALRQWLEQTQARIPGKSELAKAIRYTLSRWQALTLVLRDGRACIDNNAAERSMRPMVIAGSFCPCRAAIARLVSLLMEAAGAAAESADDRV